MMYEMPSTFPFELQGIIGSPSIFNQACLAVKAVFREPLARIVPNHHPGRLPSMCRTEKKMLASHKHNHLSGVADMDGPWHPVSKAEHADMDSSSTKSDCFGLKYMLCHFRGDDSRRQLVRGCCVYDSSQ